MWQWYNKRNCKEVNENCDAIDVDFAIISIVVISVAVRNSKISLENFQNSSKLV